MNEAVKQIIPLYGQRVCGVGVLAELSASVWKVGMETTSAAEQVGIADQADAAGFGIVCVCVSAKGPSALERLFKTVPSLGPAAFDEICWGVNDLVIGRRKSVSALRPTALAARWTLLSERVSA